MSLKFLLIYRLLFHLFFFFDPLLSKIQATVIISQSLAFDKCVLMVLTCYLIPCIFYKSVGLEVWSVRFDALARIPRVYLLQVSSTCFFSLDVLIHFRLENSDFPILSFLLSLLSGIIQQREDSSLSIYLIILRNSS